MPSFAGSREDPRSSGRLRPLASEAALPMWGHPHRLSSRAKLDGAFVTIYETQPHKA